MVNCTLYKALEVDWGGSATRRGGIKGGSKKASNHCIWTATSQIISTIITLFLQKNFLFFFFQTIGSHPLNTFFLRYHFAVFHQDAQRGAFRPRLPESKRLSEVQTFLQVAACCFALSSRNVFCSSHSPVVRLSSVASRCPKSLSWCCSETKRISTLNIYINGTFQFTQDRDREREKKEKECV